MRTIDPMTGNPVYEVTVAKQNVIVSAQPLRRADRYYPFPTGGRSGPCFNTKMEAYEYMREAACRDAGTANPDIIWTDISWPDEDPPEHSLQYFWQGEYYDQPSVEQLEEWLFDGGCETPAGDWVEPDAPDSWLSLLGLI